ncbi:MAG TPA: BMP family protein [Methylomirabilota bacterium]|nr:BMP family protein [Methylomirabilota bacterium]
MQPTSRRKILSLPVAALCAIGVVGLCGPAAQAGEVKKIAVLTPEDPTDYGWNQQGFDAAKAVAAKYGLEFMPATGLGYGDVHSTLRELAGDGASLMIAHASGYNTAAPEVAAETNVPVAIVDRPNDSKPGLIADYTLSGHEGAYLAGWLAGKMSKTGTVGIVTSGEPPSWNSQSAAFAQGAKAQNGGIKIVYAVIGPAAYSDAAGGRRVTESVIGAGADVVFGQGDGASFGMLQAVETTKATNGGQAWFIDVIGDKTKIDKGFLLSSVVWNLVPVYSAMVEDLKAGTFGTKHYQIGLADDSVNLLHTKHIPDDVWADVMKVRDDIVSGKTKIEPIFDAQKVRALMTSVSAQ